MITYTGDEDGVTPYDLDTVANHECNRGYVLNGTETRTCVEDDGLVGVFTEDPLICERKTIISV